MQETEVKVIRLPVSIKVEDAANNTRRITVTIDGEDEQDVVTRVANAYFKAHELINEKVTVKES